VSIEVLNTLIQGGSFAVIVFIIAAMVYYFPRFRKENEAREDRREGERAAESKRRDDTYERTLQSIANIFREDVKQEREACTRQYALILEAFAPLRTAIERQSQAIDVQTRTIDALQAEFEALRDSAPRSKPRVT